MAYADWFSLVGTTTRLETSPLFSISPTSGSNDCLNIAVVTLQEVLIAMDKNFVDNRGERMNALYGQARDALRALEDSIDQSILSQSDHEGTPLIFSVNVDHVWEEICILSRVVMEMSEYFEELMSNKLPEEEVEDDVVSSRTDHILVNWPKMVGFKDEFQGIALNILGLELLKNHGFSELHPPSPWMTGVGGQLFFALLGMAGVGKTTIAKEVFGSPSILSKFDYRVWVTVGPKRSWKRIIPRILAQVDPENYTTMMKLGEMELKGYVQESMKEKKCLIVLDDVWSKEICEGLQECLPDKMNGSVVLVTTRLLEIAQSCTFQHEVRLRDEEESWDILRERLFGEERCPSQLVKAGKKIANECDGLPLLIVEVAKILSKVEKTPEYWNKVAKKQNSVFMDAHEQISEVLLPSYTHLPLMFRVHFDYMGVFPYKYRMTLSELSKLWDAEGFLPYSQPKTPKDWSLECFEAMIIRNLVIFKHGNYKTCRLHSVFWYLCNREAGKNKFFHVLKKRADSLTESIKGQRRLCIQNSTLFAIKDVYDSMASISAARSLLCTGPYHQYPVPLCFGLRLLRVLYALRIRFYEFPMEVVKLVLLRFLSLTYDGNIPPSISKLWNLEYLIVDRHLSIKSSRDSSYLPMEIWDMKELKHLQVRGSDLPEPCGAFLPNLLTLSDVSSQSCTKCVFGGVPNLKKLGVRIEFSPDASETLGFFDHVLLLHNLDSLKCVIVNPNLRSPRASIAKFSSALKNLSLSGLGYPWEDMTAIASLPNLEVLKLRCYAFRGPVWEVREMGLFRIQSRPTKGTKENDKKFPQLQRLLIEDTDLVHWRIRRASFPSLQYISIKHCYKLERIPSEFVYSTSLRKIELVDCSPLAVTSLKQLEDDKLMNRDFCFGVSVHSSWDNGNTKSRLES